MKFQGTTYATVPAAEFPLWFNNHDGLAYSKFLDGFWADGPTGKWSKAGAASNTALVKGLRGLGIDIGPASSKMAIVLDADPVIFKAKTLAVLAGADEIFKRGIREVRH